MTNGIVQLERKNKIATVTMNRENRKNAFDDTMFQSLEDVTGELKKDLPRAVILTGSGNEAFSAGFDVNPDNPMVNDILKVLESNDAKTA